jgi:mevalonate kinase
MDEARTYSSKIMLFGEYALMAGSPAISIPFRHFRAALGFTGRHEGASAQALQSNSDLWKYFREYLSGREGMDETLDLARMEYDLEEGLFLDSDIPVRSGLGSSGALCAAVYGKYARQPVLPWEERSAESWGRLRKIFMDMESWFHGRSSGFDAMVSYLERPLLLSGSGEVGIPSLGAQGESGLNFFLAWGGPRLLASDHIRSYMSRFFGVSHDSHRGRELAALNSACVSALLEGNSGRLFNAFKELSGFQLREMGELIPSHLTGIWSESLGGDKFCLKVCGSGGGGYFLGLTTDICASLEYFRTAGIDVIPVEQGKK